MSKYSTLTWNDWILSKINSKKYQKKIILPFESHRNNSVNTISLEYMKANQVHMKKKEHH